MDPLNPVGIKWNLKENFPKFPSFQRYQGKESPTLKIQNPKENLFANTLITLTLPPPNFQKLTKKALAFFWLENGYQGKPSFWKWFCQKLVPKANQVEWKVP